MEPDSKIADVATGTGVFLLDLAKRVPKTCQLDGFDISASAFPSDAERPTNVSFYIQDAKKPYPSNLRHTYDLVNIRLMVAGLDKDDWVTVASHAISLLKPGGCIQWAEGEFLSATYQYTKPDSKTVPAVDDYKDRVPEGLQELYDDFKAGMRERLQYGFSTLKGIFEQQGLQHVTQHVVPSDNVPELCKELTRVNVTGVLGWQHQLQSRGAPGAWTSERIEDIKRKINNEIEDGAILRFYMHVISGRAPLSQ